MNFINTLDELNTSFAAKEHANALGNTEECKMYSHIHPSAEILIVTGGELTVHVLGRPAEKVPAGCDGMSMLPYFCGSTIPNYNPEATATFSGITLSHTKGHFARSIMEAVAFMLRLDLEYAKVPADSSIRITGGGASSPLWAGIKADVTGMKLDTVSEAETACLGTAILAMVGDGAYASIEDAARATVKTKKSYLPTGTDYTEAYKRYCALDDLLNKR